MPLFKIGTSVYEEKKSYLYLMQGTATRDAERNDVNNVDHAVVGIAAAQDKNGDTIFVNLNGWRYRMPDVAAIRKLDSILAVGKLKSREYEGKTYYDMDADFVCKSGAGLIGVPVTVSGGYNGQNAGTDGTFTALLDDDSEDDLPF